MFASWDIERSVLVSMLVLILAGLGFIAFERSKADELRAGLSGAERQLAKIGVRTDEVRSLQDEMTQDAVASGKLSAYAYIERQLVETRVGKTSFSFAPPKVDRHENDGYEDTSYQLTQAQQGRDSFTREEIGMFLLYVEGNTTRMKATRIKLDRSNKAAAEQDAWKAGVTITDRRPITKQ